MFIIYVIGISKGIVHDDINICRTKLNKFSARLITRFCELILNERLNSLFFGKLTQCFLNIVLYFLFICTVVITTNKQKYIIN